MLSEKIRNDDYIKVLKDQLQAYITELSKRTDQKFNKITWQQDKQS